MVLYDVERPLNYEEKRKIGNDIGNIILDLKIPSPSQISAVFGDNAVDPYIMMHGLMHSIGYGRERGVLEPARRDKKAIQIHSYDGAFRPLNRLFDKEYPSGYILNEKDEVPDQFVHDIPEEFGRTLLRALVTIDCIKYLNKARGESADLYTNRNALLLKPLEDMIKLESLKNHKSIDDMSRIVYDLLGNESKTGVSYGDISNAYWDVLNAVEVFATHIKEEVDYMPKPDKDDLLTRVNDMSSKLRKKIGNREFLETEDIANKLSEGYGHIMEIVDNREYIISDENLLLPDDPAFLIILKKTLYRDFVYNKIAEEVRRNPLNVSPMILKSTDSTDNVNKMDYDLSHITSIFRKSREVMRVGLDTVLYLKARADKLENQEDENREVKLLAINYERLCIATYSLLINLDGVINERLSHLRDSFERENRYYQDMQKFGLMEVKMRALKNRFDNTVNEKRIFGDFGIEDVIRGHKQPLLF
ncbi:MAG: hypothetical protein V1831_03940 [Candidatus Woesearchaeota archaeon]